MTVYPLDERPDVEVEVDGTWYPGELRGWWDRDGARLMNAQWHPRATETRLDTVPANRVREVCVVRPPVGVTTERPAGSRPDLMTTTPQEPDNDPQIAPSGDPAVDPSTPSQEPDGPPDNDPESGTDAQYPDTEELPSAVDGL